MRKGKIHQVTSITNQIRNIIITSNKLSLTISKKGSKAMWSTVKKLRGKIPPASANSNIDADKFNSYFASISNSSNYIEPTHKLSAPHLINYTTSSTVYYIFNKNCLKGTGSDGLPGWFLKLICPAICEPLSTIYNNCIKQAFFPAQWKNSIIHPIKKINNPTQPNQYRLISITPILYRILWLISLTIRVSSASILSLFTYSNILAVIFDIIQINTPPPLF